MVTPVDDLPFEENFQELVEPPPNFAWTLLQTAIEYRDSLGNFSLLGIVTINWREIPCVMGLAIAVMQSVKALLFSFATPPISTVVLATVSAMGIHYIRESLNLRNLSSQITTLKETLAQLEQIRIKYAQHGAAVEITLQELHDVEIALSQTNKLLFEREQEYRSLNEAHRDLYLKYEALLTTQAR